MQRSGSNPPPCGPAHDKTSAVPATDAESFRIADPGIPASAASALADGIAATLRVARGLALAGRPVDLTGLDGMVGVLCARALDLPPAEGRCLRPRLAELLTELDTLGAALPNPLPP